ncbi:MAG: SDR family oxidoreductase [Alphaproteobacteria bacterium]
MGFTKSLALEPAAEGITANCISPGPFLTEMNLPVVNDPEANKLPVRRRPGRWGKWKRSRARRYLRDLAGFVTGTDILDRRRLDGCRRCWRQARRRGVT